MGSYEELATVLLGAEMEKALAAENPYFQLQAVPEMIPAVLTKALAPQIGENGNLIPSRYSTSEVLPWALGSGLVSGLLGTLGQGYQTKLSDRFTDTAYGSLFGPVENPGLPPSLFRSASQLGKISGLKRNVELQDKLIDREIARQQKIDEALAAQGFVRDSEGNAQQIPGFNVSSVDAAKAAAKKVAEMMAEDSYYKGLNAPQKAAPPKLETIGLNADGTPIQIESAGEATTPDAWNLDVRSPEYKGLKEQEERLDALRKEFSSLPEIKNYSVVQKSAGIIAEAVKDPNSVSDQELVRYSILLIEPGMAVREGEQRAIASSQSIPQALRGQLAKALAGESALSPEARAGIINLAQRSYNGHKAQYDKALAFYKEQARAKGLDPNRVSYLGEAPDVGSVMKLDLKSLARQFPNTPEGRAAFKQKAKELGFD